MKERKPLKAWHLIALVVIIILAVGNKIYHSLWTKATVRIAGQEVRVLVADTSKHRFQGWSDKKDMGKYGGMLFVFPERDRYVMVMRDMYFPLDIVWLDGVTIVDIAPNLPPQRGVAEEDLTQYHARASSTLVLELPAGFAQRYGVKIGDQIEIVEE